MTYKTMKLGTDSWDLVLDANGNIAIADDSYSVAQDVASACLVFSGECFFDNTLGIPWKEDVLGHRPTPGYVAQKLQSEAQKLPIVDQALATVFFDTSTRRMRGAIRVTDTNGNEATAML